MASWMQSLQIRTLDLTSSALVMFAGANKPVVQACCRTAIGSSVQSDSMTQCKSVWPCAMLVHKWHSPHLYCGFLLPLTQYEQRRMRSTSSSDGLTIFFVSSFFSLPAFVVLISFGDFCAAGLLPCSLVMSVSAFVMPCSSPFNKKDNQRINKTNKETSQLEISRENHDVM